MPVAGFVAAHNANDYLARYLQDARAAMSGTIPTVSNAMDVGAPSNFERLRQLLPGDRLHGLVRAVSVSDEQTIDAMRKVFGKSGYTADPHTAVGLETVDILRRKEGLGGPVVVMSTANPAKFPDTCRRATGVAPEEPEQLARLRELPSNKQLIEADTAKLAARVRTRLGL
ncbi:MAG: threonine synthase, partial [Bacteroidetes bacterium]|nr:threonine synthase [Bacteroidota bacterium]